MAKRSISRPELLSVDEETGKPRLRVPAGWDYTMYRNLNMPNQGAMIFPSTSGRTEAEHRDKAVKALRDLDRVGDGLRQIGEQVCHLHGALEVVGVVGHLEAFIVVDVGVGVDADEDVLEGGVFLVDVVAVVGGDQRQAGLPAHLQ